MDESSGTRTSPPPPPAPSSLTMPSTNRLPCCCCATRNPYTMPSSESPVEEVLAMVRWALSHRYDEGFDTEKILTDWTKKRERGVWSGRPTKPSPKRQDLNGKLARLLADYWSQHPEELAAVLDQVEASINGNGSAQDA
jgi:hypothetical protein